jgi:hypothetical protein
LSQQQTVLRVLTNIPDNTISGGTVTQYDYLDLYSDIPIKINKSFAELQDIATKNSDYSIGLSLPGSKKNNRFFESFFNVETQSLYFNASKRVECSVLLNDQAYFRGYLRLNKVSVLDSKVEYDVTLYSTVGNLFGNIGNNLLKDLNFNDSDYFFNHIFGMNAVGLSFRQSNFNVDGEKPYPYIYPIVHNGYEYSGTTVTFSGATSGSTRFYTSTSPISGFTSQAAAFAAGVEQYYINSPGQGLINNQLKPALNIWSLIELIFKTYGYTIKSDFMNTPWIKSLYMYGYFSSEATKFGYKITNIQELPHEGVEIITYIDTPTNTLNTVVCKLGTGIPCFSLEDITYTNVFTSSTSNGIIKAGTSGNTISYIGGFVRTTSSDVAVALSNTLKYRPRPIGEAAIFEDGNFVDFGLVIDQNIKQIDVLSSVAKKFNLVFIPDPEIPNQLIIEPFDFYMGTGNIYDWTPMLSYDKGWSVEPALNFIESTLLLSDKEDQDEGNREFKARNNRIYGQNNVYNPTDFKSQNKTIDTIFSPELIRKWDKDGVNNIGLPLGINYAASSAENTSGTTNTVTWSYKGVKTQPKLFYWLGAFNPFLDQVNEVYNNGAFNTYSAYLTNSSDTFYSQYNTIPAISHTMPMGLEDNRKINNDSLSILFNSELPTNIGVQTFNVYTENDVYNKFYRNRITNLYNPNTRFLNGYFDLKYSDVQNLNGNDLIKINEQLFLVNKLNDYNLTNRELTNVELVQFNVRPQTYVDRYFKYTYLDTGTCHKFKTDFTNPNLLDTNYGWSVYYDHQLGSIAGTTATGFTSAFLNIQGGLPKYIGYTMTEITEQEYNTTICKDWSCDSLHNNIYSLTNGPFDFSMPTYWTNSGATNNGVNLFNNTSDFSTTVSTYGILTGSSIFYGTVFGGICGGTPTPTPIPATATPTPTATNTPTPTVTPTPTPTATPEPGEGQFMLIANQIAAAAQSITTGTTWVGLTGLRNYGGRDVDISNTGQYQGISFDSGPVYISNNYGSTWVNPAPFSSTTRDNISISIGGTGQFMAVARRPGQILLSSDYGVTWSARGLAPKWVSIAISDNGQYFIGSVNELADPTSNIYISSNSGITMNRVFPYGFDIQPNSVDMSGTGQYMTAVTEAAYPTGSIGWILVSTNYGMTFTNTNPGFNLGGGPQVAMSSTGQYQLITLNAPSFILLSTDFGQTWSNIDSLIPSPPPVVNYNGPAVSKNGKYMLVTAGGGDTDVWVSDNYGVTWTKYNQTFDSGWRSAIN